MKIGIFASNEYPYPVPPGSIQAALSMAGLLVDTLVDLGEEVTFFCSEDSQTKAKKVSLGYQSMYFNKVSDEIPGMLPRNHIKTMDIQKMFSEVISYLQKNPVDILQLHNIRETLPFLRFLPNTPKVITMNDNPFEPHHRYFLEQYKNVSDIHFVSVSLNQRRALSDDFGYASNIYNGIDINNFKFENNPSGNLIFVGRFLKKKGVDIALQVASEMNEEITVAGFFPWNEEKTSDFYQTVTRLLKENNVTHYDHADHEKEIPGLFAQSKAFLFPVHWEEPFGLTLVESMACGTPVIAFAQGATSEIIDDGKTGFLVNLSHDDKRGDWIIKEVGKQGLQKAIQLLNKMSKTEYQKMRLNCRKHVENKFTLVRMSEDYRKVYQKIIRNSVN